MGAFSPSNFPQRVHEHNLIRTEPRRGIPHGCRLEVQAQPPSKISVICHLPPASDGFPRLAELECSVEAPPSPQASVGPEVSLAPTTPLTLRVLRLLARPL